VLSKLRIFTQRRELLPPLADEDFRHLGDALGLVLSHILPITAGTMGECFTADASGQPIFLKTHRLAGDTTLVKEATLAARAYGEPVGIRLREIGVRAWMASNVLEPAAPLSPDRACHLTQDYAARLADMHDAATIVPREDDFSLLLAMADEALKELSAQQAIDQHTQTSAAAALTHLGRADFGRCLCHGDLGPKNIMSLNGEPMAIDWEDAFWGIEGYDYLLWLTFFENRRHYADGVLGRTPWGLETERAILVMIVILKCALSFRNKTHIGNALSFDQRIVEVLTLT